MAVRYRIKHVENINGTTIEYRADVIDNQYSGAVTENYATDSFFELSYDEIDPRDPFSNPLQKSSFICNMLFQDGDDISIIDDIVSADNQRFQINFYINGDIQWSGKILSDLMQYPEGPYPWSVQLVAKDLSVLEGIDYPRATEATRTRISQIFAECFQQTGLTLPIRSYTNLTHANANVNESQDFLYALYHQKKALQNKNTKMTCAEVLGHFCRAYNLIIRQANARWIIEQLPAVAKGDDLQFDYDSNGLNPASSTPSRAITIDRTDSFVLPDSSNRAIAALKEIRSTYNHRTAIETDQIDDVIRTSEFDPPPTYDIDVDDIETGHTITVNMNAAVTVSNPSGFMSGNAYFQLRGIRNGEPDVILESDGTLGDFEQKVSVNVSGSGAVLTGSYSAELTVPTILFAPIHTIRVRFFWGDAEYNGSEKNVSQVEFTDIDIQAVKDERDWSASTESVYKQTGNYALKEEIPPTIIGDGPNTKSMGIPAHDALVTADLVPGGFRIRGVTEQVNLQELTLRERMKMRRRPLRNGQFSLWILYSPANLLNYDGASWFFLGGKFVANRSRWSASLIQFDYLGGVGDEFSGYDGEDNRGGSGPPGDTFISNLQAIGELREDLRDATVTTIDVDLDVPVQAGFEYWVINDNELSTTDREAGIYPVIPETTDGSGTRLQPEDSGYEDGIKKYGPGLLQDANGLPIQEQVINAPEGSIIVKAPGQDDINIQFYDEVTVGVEREKKADSIGVVSVDIGAVSPLTGVGFPDGNTRTTISLEQIDDTVELADGQALLVVSKRGLSEIVTVDGDQTITPTTDTLTIIPKVFDHFYGAGKAIVKEAGYKLSSRLNTNIFATDNNFTSIATLETFVNIGGGEAFSGLNLRSDITTNEDGIATNASSIATLETHVNLAGGTAYSALNMRSDIDTNETTGSTNASSIATLETHVNLSGGSAYSALTLKSEIGQNDSAIANLTAAVDILETDSGAVIRSITEPTTRPSNEPLQTGDIWLDPSTYDPAADPPTDNTVRQWDGSAWVDFNGVINTTMSQLNLDVDKYRARAMLSTDKNGNIGYIDIQSDDIQSTIAIKADQVDINGVSFDSDGAMYSNNFNGGITSGTIDGVGSAGWAIDRTGQAVFNDVVVRNEGDDIGVEGGNVLLKARVGSTTSGRRVEFWQTSKTNTVASIAYLDATPYNGFQIQSDKGILLDADEELNLFSGTGWDARIRSGGAGNIVLENVSSGNIKLDLSNGSGELQFEVNSSNGMNIKGLPTSNPGGSGNIWIDGNTLKIT